MDKFTMLKNQILKQLSGVRGFGGIGESVTPDGQRCIVIIEDVNDENKKNELAKKIPRVTNGIPVIIEKRKHSSFL